MREPYQLTTYGEQECPKCKFSMERLRDSAVLDMREGYSMNYSVGWDPDENLVTSLLVGWWQRYVWKHTLGPILSKWWGEWKSRRYRKTLREYPRTLICTHCRYLLKRT